MQRFRIGLQRIAIALGFIIISVLFVYLIQVSSAVTSATLLTDPFLQLPTESSVRVVWFTEFEGVRHTVTYDAKTVSATTTKLRRSREDQDSKISNPPPRLTQRNIWRHEAKVDRLETGKRYPYHVTSVREDGATVESATFTLTSKPAATQALKILLTSDHQLKPMVPANLQKVVETIGSVDAVFMAGDLVNVPDRASEWFDDDRGNAFFPTLQGRANYTLNGTRYTGGAILQSTPMYTAIGNHEVMGRFSNTLSLDEQFSDAFPRHLAQRSTLFNPDSIKNQSYNTDTYEEILTLPESASGGKQYYAETFGNVRLVVLYLTNVWRTPQLTADAKGKYREREADFDCPDRWGHGQIIFCSIAPDSPQRKWLTEELNSQAFQQAQYKIVMFHHPPHSLGDNIVPPYTDPIQTIDPRSRSIRYEYPQSEDYLIRDLVPMLEKAGVQLVLYGHTHIWNRFVSSTGMHFLETSNVGNSYGAYVGEKRRDVPKNSGYAETGNPNGLAPIVPSIAPLRDALNQPVPYIASNDVTVFSVFDTQTGTVSSYRFDTRKSKSEVIKFDEFTLGRT